MFECVCAFAFSLRTLSYLKTLNIVDKPYGIIRGILYSEHGGANNDLDFPYSKNVQTANS